jgi:L-lactate dehydrogenase complex protein LldG
MTTSREDILKRIDAAKLGMDATAPARTYVTDSALSREELIDLLEDRIVDYKATFTRTSDVAATIASLVSQHNLEKIVIPSGLPTHWASGTKDVDLTSADLDQFDAVITSSEVSIAVTGTIILNHSRDDQGRRAISLVPDTHICVVSASSVVGTVVEAVRSLNAKDHQTWISGPSATSDIELERVEGVHGPRNLHVVLDLSDLKDAK